MKYEMKLAKTVFYSNKERKFLGKHPDLIEKYEKVLEDLQINPFTSSLKTHRLKGNLKAFHACSLTFDYRIVCTILIQDDEITLVDIGNHDDVY